MEGQGCDNMVRGGTEAKVNRLGVDYHILRKGHKDQQDIGYLNYTVGRLLHVTSFLLPSYFLEMTLQKNIFLGLAFLVS